MMPTSLLSQLVEKVLVAVRINVVIFVMLTHKNVFLYKVDIVVILLTFVGEVDSANFIPSELLESALLGRLCFNLGATYLEHNMHWVIFIAAMDLFINYLSSGGS